MLQSSFQLQGGLRRDSRWGLHPRPFIGSRSHTRHDPGSSPPKSNILASPLKVQKMRVIFAKMLALYLVKLADNGKVIMH